MCHFVNFTECFNFKIYSGETNLSLWLIIFFGESKYVNDFQWSFKICQSLTLQNQTRLVSSYSWSMLSFYASNRRTLLQMFEIEMRQHQAKRMAGFAMGSAEGPMWGFWKAEECEQGPWSEFKDCLGHEEKLR